MIDPPVIIFSTRKIHEMKNLLAAIASFILLQQAPVKLSAQTVESNEVPKRVIQAHSKKFPDSEIRKWEIRHDGYIALFRSNGKKHTAYYTPEGHWKATESTVKWTRHLPDPVKEGWKNSGYYTWYVHNMKKIETDGQRLYVLHVHNGPTLDANKIDAFGENHVLYFTQEGKLIRTERI